MKFVIRTDASANIGTGHVMRCLTLAEMISDLGGVVSFICLGFSGDMRDYIEERGFPVAGLKIDHSLTSYSDWGPDDQLLDAKETGSILSSMTDVDWLIVDHYAIDVVWERRIRPLVRNLMVIDDLANREHVCDVLLDQNLYDSMQNRYQGIVPETCRQLLGPEYAILRKEFYEARRKIPEPERSGKIKRVFVFFGGSDPTGETIKILQAITSFDDEICFDIVVGKSNLNRYEIESICADVNNINYYCQIDNISELMMAADVAIGAAGSASWERCFLGLPAIVVITAENQIGVAEKLANENAVINLGESAGVHANDYLNAVRNLCDQPGLLQTMSKNGLRIMSENRLQAEISSLMGAVG